jgi:hypothetical protein
MTALTRWVPRLIDGLAVVHLAYGVAAPEMADALRGIVAGGVVNTVAGQPAHGLWMWSMATGVALLGLGEVARWAAKETGRLPARLGGWLLALAVPMVVLEPVSGGWLVGALGLLALAAARGGVSPVGASVDAARPRPAA